MSVQWFWISLGVALSLLSLGGLFNRPGRRKVPEKPE